MTNKPECMLGHGIDGDNYVHTDIGVVCTDHMPNYYRAARVAKLTDLDDPRNETPNSGYFRKRTREILMDGK